MLQRFGVVTSITTLCFDILTKAREMAATLESSSVTLVVHPDIANELKTHKAALLEEFKRVTKKNVMMETDAHLD